MSDFVENLPVLPLEDVEIEYQRASRTVKQAVTGLLSMDKEHAFVISLLNLEQLQTVSGNPQMSGAHIGFGLYSMNEDTLPTLMGNLLESLTDLDMIEAAEHTFEQWIEGRNGEDLEQRV